MTVAVAGLTVIGMAAVDASQDNRLADPPQRKDCPHCGANCWMDDENCWHCHRMLASPPVKPRFIQFSLGTLLLVMTVFAVVMGTVRWLPLFAAALLVWILPAVLHTYLSCRILRARVPPVTLGERFDRFGLSLLYVILVLLTAIVAALVPAIALTWVLSRIQPSQVVAGLFIALVIVTAGLCGTTAGGWVLWRTLPRPPRDST